MKYWKELALVGLALLYTFLVHSCGQESGRIEGALALSQLESKLQEEQQKAATAKQELERQIADKTDRKTHEHSQAMDSMQRGIAAARAESDGLRNQLEELRGKLQRQPTVDTGAGFQLAPGVKAAMVLSDLLSSCSAERSELAGKFDTSHARGVAVEEQYNMVRAMIMNKTGQ